MVTSMSYQKKKKQTIYEEEGVQDKWYTPIYSFTQRLIYYFSEQEFNKQEYFFYQGLPEFVPLLGDTQFERMSQNPGFYQNLFIFYEEIGDQFGVQNYKQVENSIQINDRGFGKLLDFNILKHDVTVSYWKMIRNNKSNVDIYSYLCYVQTFFQKIQRSPFYEECQRINDMETDYGTKQTCMYQNMNCMYDLGGMLARSKITVIYPPHPDTPTHRNELL